MAEYITALTNRLGNRASNQDRCLIEEKPGQVLLVVADGMGGHARGDLAAQTAVDSLANSFRRQPARITDPQAFLVQAMATAHLDVVGAGKALQPPAEPRTTCVACLVDGDHAGWAHVGDSRLYLLRNHTVLQRTRDHTPLEELRQAGVVDDNEMRDHPLRNSVSRCLGGSARPPQISYASARLQTGDTLLLCSDGLWSALMEEQLIALGTSDALESDTERLAALAETASYPHSDNISIVVLRWLEMTAGKTPAADSAATGAAAKDPLQQAIDDIHRAMLDYASEIKKT